MKMANGGTVGKMKKKVKDTLKKLKPKPTGRPEKVKDFFKKKKKDKIKDKVKQKLKEKKKTKSTKTGLLSKAGIAPVSAPGGIPVVQSQKTAQKDPPKKPRKRRDLDDLLQGPKNPDRPPIKPMPMPRPKRPEGGPKPIPMPIPKRPKGGPKPIPMPSPRMTPEDIKRFRLMKDGGELKKMFAGKMGAGMTRAKLKRAFDMAKKMKPSGRINADDMRRVAKMLGSGKKPVLDSKGKPVKNLFQKSKKRDLKSIVKTGPMGMRKPFGGKNLKAAARKMRKMM